MWKWIVQTLTADTFPIFGQALLLGVMLLASYTFAVSLSAGATGSVRKLQAARLGGYATVALIFTAVVVLAYAFVSHDFRLRYVAQHSDRSMPTIYLLTALWGGQDGSLLWWLFLLSIYIGVCIFWLGNKYLELQPYVLATLMVIVVFFCILMVFSANPFATGIAGARADGDGMNPLLQTFYMIIHPPALYVGFVGCAVPFSFAVAALVTGRLDTEWITAARKWALFAWLFLSIGNTLGMLWAYEELGWGGYWGWDPVENAAFMPWLTASAYLHSVMLQERRGLLKVWNVALVTITFLMTIFGTFLTRSGVIASVHSFAQSSIGEYFVGFLVVAAAFMLTLILYRWPELRDLPPRKEVRLAVVLTGWSMVALIAFAYWVTSKVGGAALPDDAGTRSILGSESLSAYQTKRTLIKVLVFSGLTGASVFATVELVFRRLTKGIDMRSKRPQIESLLSRESTFLMNNLGLVIFLFFVLAFTTFPMVSKAFWKEDVSVGPPVYNAWLQPVGLTIFMLMGVGTLFGWKKTSEASLKKNYLAPGIAFFAAIALHVLVGPRIGYPPVVWSEPIYAGPLGAILRVTNAFTPVVGFSLVVFNLAVVVQEFALLATSRSRTGADKTPAWLWYAGVLPGVAYMLLTLPSAGRRRYGGYIVHLGIIVMFCGFTGHSWNIDRETTLMPGQTYSIDDYTLEYQGTRMEVDNSKRALYADIKVSRKGKPVGQVAPAKFFYKKQMSSPTTEVSMLHSFRDDLYVVVGTANPQTKAATFQVHVNPLVGFIWFGCLVLILGSFVCMWPELVPGESRAWRYARGSAAVATSILMGIILAMLPAPAFAQQQGGSHAGTVQMDSPQERDVFSKLRCMCGTCPRDLLSTCACGTADETRQRIRAKLAKGETTDAIIAAYAAEYGSEALAVPPNQGVFRALYAVPILAGTASVVGLAFLVRRWRAKGDPGGIPPKKTDGAAKDVYDDRIDQELRELDD